MLPRSMFSSFLTGKTPLGERSRQSTLLGNWLAAVHAMGRGSRCLRDGTSDVCRSGFDCVLDALFGACDVVLVQPVGLLIECADDLVPHLPESASPHFPHSKD